MTRSWFRTGEAILPAGLAGLAGCLAPACGWPSAQERFPAPTEALRIVQTVPASGAQDVAPEATVDVCFSRPVDPRTLDDFDAVIRSGNLLFDTQAQLQLVPWRGPAGADPGNSPWCPGSVVTVTPKGLLQRGVLYRLYMKPSARGWGGEVLQTEGDGWTLNDDGDPRFVVEFQIAPDAADSGAGTTGSGTGGTEGPSGTSGTAGTTGPGDPPWPAEVRLADLFEAGRVFDPDGSICSCHTPSGLEKYAVGYERLDLSSPESAHADLVQVSGVRETGFPMIAPHNPSESYLLHKVLRDPDKDDGSPLHGVIGDAMPLGTVPLPYPMFVDLALWIEAGAEL
jgi:hypothetical protein